YSAETTSGPSFNSERSTENNEQLIPTRQQLKLTSQVAHNPLQFVTAQSGATALCEQAKQQLIISDQQKRLRDEVRKNMHSDDDETGWQSNLDSWLSKRKTAILRWKDDMKITDISNKNEKREATTEKEIIQQQQQQEKQRYRQQSRNDNITDSKKILSLISWEHFKETNIEMFPLYFAFKNHSLCYKRLLADS
ncbi:unnamed protein product, partial [Onchocerca ochengi]